MVTTIEPGSPEGSLDDVSAEQWAALSSRQVFFGHQSVGGNIMDGVRALLRDRSEIQIEVITSDRPERVDGPALVEARIGENRHPETKSEAFARILDRGFGSRPGAIALHKYCYVDIAPGTDPEELFDTYARHLESIRRRHADLTVAHVTLPLTTAPTGLWERAKTRIGVDTATRLNFARERFNELLRRRYGDREPVFDLALLESISPDGSRATSRFRGRKVPMLAPGWTNDGGHLNEDARTRVAEQFLVFLAGVASRNSRGPDTTDETPAVNRH